MPILKKLNLKLLLIDGDDKAVMDILSTNNIKSVFSSYQSFDGVYPDYNSVMNTATFNFGKLFGLYSSMTTQLLDPTNFLNITSAFDGISELYNKESELKNFIQACQTEAASLNLN